MSNRICEFCGTEYSVEEAQCPLCGEYPTDGSEPAEEARPKRTLASSGGARVATKASKNAKAPKTPGEQQPERIPRWMWGVICAVLGLAVIIGLGYFIYDMGYFSGNFSLTEIPTLQEQEAPEYQTQQPQPQEIPVPEVPEVPEEPEIDLSVCTDLILSQDMITLGELGAQALLTTLTAPEGCTAPISFASDDEKVAVVDASGLITAVAPGVADIYVTCGDVTRTCTVLCDFVVEVEPTLSEDTVILASGGETAQLTVNDLPEGETAIFASNDPAVATVDDTGLITAVDLGTARITVTIGGTQLVCEVICEWDPSLGATGNYTTPLTFYTEYGKVYQNDITLRVGESCNLTLKDANGTTVTGLTWTVANGGMVTVTETGKLTVHGHGITEVTTVVNGETYTLTVRG